MGLGGRQDAGVYSRRTVERIRIGTIETPTVEPYEWDKKLLGLLLGAILVEGGELQADRMAPGFMSSYKMISRRLWRVHF